MDNIGSGYDIEFRLRPVNAVLTDCVAGALVESAYIPHFIDFVLRIVPDSIAKGESLRRVFFFLLPGFPRFIGDQHGTGRVNSRGIKGSL